MSKVLTDQIEKRTGGTAMDVPAAGKWPTANIADDAVTLAKMAGLARGKLIVGDASGDPSALTVGTADQVLMSDGTDASWSDLSTGTAWQGIQTANFTAVAGNGYPINTTSAAITVTLPAAASVGDTIEFMDYARQWGNNNVTLATNGLNYQGNTSPNPQYTTNGESLRIVYADATKGWIPVFDGAVALETPQITDIEWLVIAGGGGGGTGTNIAHNRSGGAGGAGGYRNSYASEPSGGGGSTETKIIGIAAGITLTATIGAGGAGWSVSNKDGGDGGDSSLIGTGVSITSAGGGGGGAYTTDGRDGGSGGGGGAAQNSQPYGAGTTNQGYRGGYGDSNTGGAGGGAAGVGGHASPPTGGQGGGGYNNTITGSAVGRGGGGGGGGQNSGTATHGGGNGGNNTGPGTPGAAGTANTGGGGGGGGEDVYISGAGGSGVVILRMNTNRYTGTVTGSPTVTTDGLQTIVTFTGTGTYTT